MQRSVTVTAKGQITIPKDMREALGLKAGDRLVWSIVDNDVIVTPKTVNLSDLAGYLGEPPAGRASLDVIDASVRDAAALHVPGETDSAREDDAA